MRSRPPGECDRDENPDREEEDKFDKKEEEEEEILTTGGLMQNVFPKITGHHVTSLDVFRRMTTCFFPISIGLLLLLSDLFPEAPAHARTLTIWLLTGPAPTRD